MSEELTVAAADEKARLDELDRLTPTEMTEYERHVRLKHADLSPDTNKRLYELFINGVSINAMMEMNRALTLGSIIKARVDGRWGARRDVYLGEILGQVPQQMRQLAAESLGFMMLQLTAFHKQHSQNLMRYIQTGNPADLKGSGLTSLKEYSRLIETIKNLTDASSGGRKDGPLVGVTVSPGANAVFSTGEDSGSQDRRFTPEQADRIREVIESRRIG
jgi:hypothetical protein